jgi:tetratricopeptide (TPR) repeat protein
LKRILERFTVARVATAAVLALSAAGGNAAPAVAAGETGDIRLSTSIFGNYLAGMYAESTRDIAASAAYFRAALARDPHNPELLRRAFRMSAVNGDWTDAIEYAGKLVADDPDFALPSLALAIDEFAGKRYAAALKRLDTLPRSGLTNFVLPMMEAWILVAQNKPDDALALLTEEAKNDGFAVLFGGHRALINEYVKRPDAAEAAYQEAADKRGAANLRLSQLHGNLLERQGRGGDARAIYDKYRDERAGSTMFDAAYVRLDSGTKPVPEVSSPADGLAEAMFSIASAIRQQNSFESSLFFARLGLLLKPKFEIAQLLIAEVLEGDRRYGEANSVYGQLASDPTFGWTSQLRIADNLDRQDKVEEAIATLRNLAGQRQDRYEPLVELGDLFRRRERFAEAVGAYDEAKKRLPDIRPHHWAMLYASGIALERSKQWDRAEADFLKALELEPDQPFVLNYLGYSWVEQGKNLKQAQEMIEKAVASRPTDGYIVDSLGWVFYQLGNLDGAVKQLERAVELQPQDPVINDHLGDVYWHVGRRQEARFQWRRALSFEPEEDLVAKIEKKLESGLPPESKPRPKDI